MNEFNVFGAQLTSAGTIVFFWRFLEGRFPVLATLSPKLKRGLLWLVGALGALGVHTVWSGSAATGWHIVFDIPSAAGLLHASYHLLQAIVFQEGFHQSTK